MDDDSRATYPRMYAEPTSTTEPAQPADIEPELERIHASSYGWALACCRFDRQEAEEVLQAAYLKAIEGRARFNGNSSLRTWFFGVVKLTAAEHRRSSLVRRLALGRWVERRATPTPTPTPEALTSASQMERRLRRALLELSPRQRDLLHLVFYEELSVAEAAEILRLPIGTARTHYERGKARLRQLLDGAGDR
jgi:RNA polymerase sigma-70 factor (ECF subfamily)